MPTLLQPMISQAIPFLNCKFNSNIHAYAPRNCCKVSQLVHYCAGPFSESSGFREYRTWSLDFLARRTSPRMTNPPTSTPYAQPAAFMAPPPLLLDMPSSSASAASNGPRRAPIAATAATDKTSMLLPEARSLSTSAVGLRRLLGVQFPTSRPRSRCTGGCALPRKAQMRLQREALADLGCRLAAMALQWGRPANPGCCAM